MGMDLDMGVGMGMGVGSPDAGRSMGGAERVVQAVEARHRRNAEMTATTSPGATDDASARVTASRIRRRTMRLATASASPLGSTFFLEMRRIASPVVAPVPPRAGVTIKNHYFVRANV